MNEIPPDASFADRFVSKVGGPALLSESIVEVLSQYGHVFDSP